MSGKEHIIDYPDGMKGKSKRNMTERKKRAAQEESMQTKAKTRGYKGSGFKTRVSV